MTDKKDGNIFTQTKGRKMTAITNLVVALMIVTQGEEPVQACPVDTRFDGVWACSVQLPEETLYRKVCKTNFVYSTTVPVKFIRIECPVLGCGRFHQYTVDELFGCPIRRFYVETSVEPYCEKHRYKSANGGAE